MKKFSKGLAVLLFVALVVLSGCSKSSTKDTANEATMAAATAEATAAPVKKVKIRILTRLASDQPNAVAFRDRVKQFQVENPNIEVEDLSIEDETSFGNKFKTSVANGDVPEIFANYGGAAFETYSQNGVAGGAISISGKAEGDKKEAAIKLLKYVTNADAFKFYQKVQKGGIFPVSFESDPANVDALTIEYSNAMKGATFKAELYSYDPLPQALDRVRNSVQGMFAGQTPEKAAQEIQDQIDKLTK